MSHTHTSDNTYGQWILSVIILVQVYNTQTGHVSCLSCQIMSLFRPYLFSDHVSCLSVQTMSHASVQTMSHASLFRPCLASLFSDHVSCLSYSQYYTQFEIFNENLALSQGGPLTLSIKLSQGLSLCGQPSEHDMANISTIAPGLDLAWQLG